MEGNFVSKYLFGSWYVAVEPTTAVCGILRRECKFCDYHEEMGFAETDKVKSITLSSHTESLIPGDTATLTAVIDPETAGNKNVIWSSSDETVASVSGGTVAAAGENGKRQCAVSTWRNIAAVSAGSEHTVGLKTDGTVVCIGKDSGGAYSTASLENIKLPKNYN